MYLTAQHVRTKDGREGVNVYGYAHPTKLYPDIDWRNPDVVRIADDHPGRLMFTILALEAQGNSIRSYLDVALSDDVPAKTAAMLLRAAPLSWRQAPSQTMSVWAHGPMALRLYVATSVKVPEATEFQRLKDKLLIAIAHVVTSGRKQPAFAVAPPQPLRVFLSHGAASDRYSLDKQSREALAQLLTGVTIPASVNVTHENRSAFEHFLGRDLVTEIVLTFANCDLNQLDALGGAIVVDQQSGRVLWRSPGLPG